LIWCVFCIIWYLDMFLLRKFVRSDKKGFIFDFVFMIVLVFFSFLGVIIVNNFVNRIIIFFEFCVLLILFLRR